MKDRNEFDELARRKLEERVFAFDEAHWTAVEGSLNAERKRSRRGLWIFSLAALFIAVGLLWWNTGDEPATTVAEQGQAANLHEATIDHTDRSAMLPAQQATTGPSATSEVNAPEAVSDFHEAPARTQPEPQQNIPTGTQQPNAQPRVSEQVSRTPSSVNSVEPHLEVQVHSSDPVVINAPKPQGLESVAAPNPGVTVTNDGGSAMPATNVDGASGEGPEATKANESVVAVNNTAAEPPVSAVNASTPPDTDPTGDHPTTSPSTAATSAPDSSATPPAQIPGASPGRWELSVLAGRFSTQSHYTWNGDLDPAIDVQHGSSTSFAAELMNMGAHFGFGVGLHLSEYAERIDARELSTSEQFQSTHYFILPVDTTILVIIDTVVVDGTVHYVTGQLDTTFNVLGSEVVTNTITEQQREARQLVNRVSYVEIPLLADAHMRCGHWNLGVRGGPTIGFLSGSRGALPNATGDGYVDLGRDHLQATVFGYTARAYVRYALNEAWALGLEPTIKGQLTSTLPKGDAVRKGSALGAFFSVTYRLP